MQSTHYGLSDSHERYSIKEWSDSLKAEEIVATFTFDADSILSIQAGERYAAKLRKIGAISSDGNNFELDMLEAPYEVIATAIGLPGQNPEFRAECARRFNGYVTAANMLEMAFEGHPMQSGRIDMGGPSRLVVMNMAQLVNLEKSLPTVPTLPGYLGAVREQYSGLLVKNVVCIKGSALLPGYIMTACPGESFESSVDRIALSLAYTDQVAKITGAKGDRVLKVGVLEDGRPYAVFSDSTRNAAKIVSQGVSKKDPGLTMVYAKFEDLRAKRGVSYSTTELGAEPDKFPTYYQVCTLRQAMEDRMHTMPSAMGFMGPERQLHADVPRLGLNTSIEGIKASVRDYSAQAEQSIRIAKMHARTQFSGDMDLVLQVKGHIKSIGMHAAMMKERLTVEHEKQKYSQNRPDRFYSSTISLEP